MVAVGGLSVLAGVVRVPYPIVLVLGGLLLGFVPGVPHAELPPELVLVLFLPPLLYQAAFVSSPRDLRADAHAITLLAVGQVGALIDSLGIAVGGIELIRNSCLPSLLNELAA
jgi:NhaP-type Na+/H+ or K+/H+ antiporter